MLPRSTNTRTAREAARGKQSGRTQEIQRLIGRSLRAVTRLDGAGRAPGDPRLRRAPGRRRHAHRLDHRRLRRPAPRPGEAGRIAALCPGCPCASRWPRCPAASSAARPCSISTMSRTAAPRPTPTSCSRPRAASSRSRSPPRTSPSARPVRGHARAGRRRDRLAGGPAAPDAGMLIAGRRLLVATHNPGKLREFEYLLEPHGIEVVGAAALGLPEPEETGDSFRANAAAQGPGRGRRHRPARPRRRQRPRRPRPGRRSRASTPPAGPARSATSTSRSPGCWTGSPPASAASPPPTAAPPSWPSLCLALPDGARPLLRGPQSTAR